MSSEGMKPCPFCGRDSEPEPKPLTLDELRERDGKPVWVCFGDGISGYAIVAKEGESFVLYGPEIDDAEPNVDFYDIKYNLDPDGHFGLHILGWLAYDRPPKEEWL